MAPATRPARPRLRRPGTWLALLLGLASIVAAAALQGRRPAVHEVVRRPGLDVLLVTIDTLRADALGAYGSETGASPLIDRLAAQGVVFRQAHAHNVVTLPSHANILSGRLPFQHGVRDNAGYRFPRETSTLATHLKSAGYRTGAFVSAFTLDSRFGLDRGFDVYDDAFAAPGGPLALPERSGSETVKAAVRWLREGDSRPSFAWVHLYDPHAPYAPPEPFASRFASRPYAGEVAATDAALEPLLGPMLEAARPDTLVVLTSDHGESLGEHGERTHGLFAYEATLRVPLVLFAPRVLPAVEVEAVVGHADLLPTILDTLALPVPADLPGRSLLPLVGGTQGPSPPLYFEALSASANRGWAPLTGVLRGKEKYIELPLPELYDLGSDPAEERNLVASLPARVERLQAALRGFPSAEAVPARAEEDRTTREALRALGYLASASAAPRNKYGPEDDPKRLVALDGLMEEVLARHRVGDLEGAIALCREIVRQRPDMPAVLLQIAILERKRGEMGSAIDALTRLIALVPEDGGTAAVLAQYLTDAGRAGEAVALLRPYAAKDDPGLDVLTALGVALAREGRLRDAAAALERARVADPSNAMARVELGTVRLLADQDALARAAFEEAVRLDPGLALAHHSLGLLAAKQGDEERALPHWRAALDRDPALVDALFRLGSALARRGRAEEARPYLEQFVARAPRPLYDREAANAAAWLRAHSNRKG
ncbi:MAG TPA: sulfatase-like hydrolase/transferase [Vicinamibacteria bacterium]|nr:sulfatase-like hydrolase/transferase [Vicinamibacteria bacterium]